MKTAEEIIKEVQFLPTFLTDDDIKGMVKYAKRLKSGAILDVGTGWGKSMLTWALANPANTVYTCDPGSYPIYQRWASSTDDYQDKIEDLIDKFDLHNQVRFYLGRLDQFFDVYLGYKFDIIFFDNWPELNEMNSTIFFRKVINKLKPDGYIFFRNYGRADRKEYTQSIDEAIVDLIFEEKIGESRIYKKHKSLYKE